VDLKKAEVRRQTMLNLKQAHGLTYKTIAALLASAIDDDVSIKAVESWLCNPKAHHHRPCPGWVVFVLQSILPSE